MYHFMGPTIDRWSSMSQPNHFFSRGASEPARFRNDVSYNNFPYQGKFLIMEDTGFSILRVVGSFIVTKDNLGMRHDEITLFAKL